MLSALSKKSAPAIDGDVDLSFFTGVPQEEAYRLMTDYFTGRGLRIVASDSPSYVNAEFGSWTSISLDNAKGEVRVDLVKPIVEVMQISILTFLQNTLSVLQSQCFS